MPRPAPAALNVSQMILRILFIANCLYAAIILAVLIGMFADPAWFLKALGFHAPADAQTTIWGIRGIAALGLAGVPLNFIVLGKFLAIVKRVRDGDPFVAENAARLRTIAWALLGQQLLAITVGAISNATPGLVHSLRVGGLSPSGLLAVFLMFVLASVFAEGARMRDDLEGTI